MKVVKPTRLGVLTRCFEHERQFRLGLCALAYIPLSEHDTILLTEMEMWKFAAPRMGAEGNFDATIPKLRAEFLVNGCAYPPGGKAASSFGVRARVGSVQKDLQVFGQRVWIGSRASDPLPVDAVPLGWEQAFGGPKYARNPLGKGIEETEVAGVKARPLPNIELPRNLITRPTDRPEPAGYGPVDVSWPQRASLAGTYDRKWLETGFPGFASDVDWAIHNVAPRDQQQDAAWAPGDEYSFVNLHPTATVVEGRLPDLRARAFVTRTHRSRDRRPSFAERKEAARRPPPALEEIPLELQTLWFFPDAMRAVLIWTGATSVVEEDAADVVQLLLAAEHINQPKPESHYMRCLAERLDEKLGGIAALRERELLPENLGRLGDQPPDEEEELNAFENPALANFHRRHVAEVEQARALVEHHGLDPDECAPPIPDPLPVQPELDDLPELFEKLEREAEAAKAEAEAEREKILGAAESALNEARDPEFTSEKLREGVERGEVGPPVFTADGQRAALEQIAAESRREGYVADQVEQMMEDEGLYKLWLEAEHGMMRAYRAMAHEQSPAPLMPPGQRDAAQASVREALAAGQDFSRLNFTGADLSGMDLRHADLRGALFESAVLTDADLTEAQLDGAVLAHAKLNNAKLTGASLREANLGKACLHGSNLDHANLEAATLSGAHMERTRMRSAKLTGTTWLKAILKDADVRGAVGDDLVFIDTTIERTDFQQARLRKGVFVERDLRGTDFSGADLTACTFVACDLREVSMSRAKLANARFVEACRLDGGKLIEAELVGANLRGSSMVEADLRRAILDDADLSECELERAKLYRAVARRTRFDVSNLRGASLMSANLMHASFVRAAIFGVDLRGANLYGCDMARVRTDERVQLDQALMTKVRIHPRHDATEQGR